MFTTNAPGTDGASTHEPSRSTCSPPLPGSTHSSVSTPESLWAPTPCCGSGSRRARVADDLDERRRFAEVRVEVVRGGAERLGPRPQQPPGDAREVLVPLGDDLLQLRLRRRPEVRADEAREVGRIRVGDRLALRTDVDLLAPVDLALRALAADPGVSAEVRALHVLDRELVRLGQGEEVARCAVQALLELGRDPGAGQVEEADVVRRGAQVRPESRGGVVAGVELREVEDRQGEVGHADEARHAPRHPLVCCTALPAAARGAPARLDMRAGTANNLCR